jgi:hypothetical protein
MLFSKFSDNKICLANFLTSIFYYNYLLIYNINLKALKLNN